tara:strand:+ start:542 stop:1246 length:705 start_codon:yes stop_codon:yes gene_type:complete
MKNKILIFTATYNEADNIVALLESIDKLKLNIDTLIIDDNSPDKTWEKIQKYSENKKNIKLIVRKAKEGLDTAHKTAYDYSIKNNYDFLITMDADLSHQPKEIPNFINALETNAFVLGSRYIEGGKCDMKGFRFFLSYLGNKFIKFVFAINCNEYTTAYRGFNLKELGDFNLNKVSSKGYSFFMETIFLVHKKGFLIKQIPIHFAHRTKGKSKIPKIELFRTLLNLFILKFSKK